MISYQENEERLRHARLKDTEKPSEKDRMTMLRMWSELAKKKYIGFGKLNSGIHFHASRGSPYFHKINSVLGLPPVPL